MAHRHPARRFVVELEGTDDRTKAEVKLRHFLKAAWWSWGLKCRAISELPAGSPTVVAGAAPASEVTLRGGPATSGRCRGSGATRRCPIMGAMPHWRYLHCGRLTRPQLMLICAILTTYPLTLGRGRL
jgi:hypothetical protein